MILAALRKGTIDQFQIRSWLAGLGLLAASLTPGGLQGLSPLTADQGAGHIIYPGWVNLKSPRSIEV
jgi:hypothetical protein